MIFCSRSPVTFKVNHIKNILYLLYYCLRDAICVTIIQEIMVKESTGDISFDLLMYMIYCSRLSVTFKVKLKTCYISFIVVWEIQYVTIIQEIIVNESTDDISFELQAFNANCDFLGHTCTNHAISHLLLPV